MRIPVVKGRRTNKILCLVFLGMAAAFLVTAGIFLLLREPVLAEVMCMLAGIVGIFVLLYGIQWGFARRREQKRQHTIERAAEILSPPVEYSAEWKEYILPREELIQTAKTRLKKFALAMAVTSAVIFIILTGIFLGTDNYGGPVQLVSLAIFCGIIAVPGTLIQYGIYRKYASSVPERILIFPSKLIVDREQFSLPDIRKIIVSSYRSGNRDGSGIFRKLIVITKEKTFTYTIDYRTPGSDNPTWEGYGEFLYELQRWARQYNAPLSVDYMN